MRIAQRFNAWGWAARIVSPEGTTDAAVSNRPFGTLTPFDGHPSVETLGYSRTSLRDEDAHILTTLVVTHRPVLGLDAA